MGCSSRTDTEDGGTTILRHVSSYLPNNIALTLPDLNLYQHGCDKVKPRTLHVHRIIVPALDILWTCKARKLALTAYLRTAHSSPRCAQEQETNVRAAINLQLV
jgi:hypothetical protein